MRLTGLDGQFADGNVTLGVLLGAIGGLTTVPRAPPRADAHTIPAACPGRGAGVRRALRGAVARRDCTARSSDALVDVAAGPGSDAPALHERVATAPRDGLLR